MGLGPIACLRRAGLTRMALAALLLALSATQSRADSGLPGKPGQLIETRPPGPVPALTFTDINEQPANLDAYKGKPLIINLWATWCAPCVKEMPSLAKLAAELKDQGVAVVAISEDRGGKFVVDPFLKDHQIEGLPVYLDKTMSTGKAFKATTILPMTLLIDAKGEEVGRVYGDRDWDTAESKAEITKLFGLKTSG
ncbi:MAG TPA: TlpA disulfide reductase family protein [Alphaproteobacteria bacterium]|nr:TlpA disulfide reductase family protein [Alphaproteobacteria bacterium]